MPASAALHPYARFVESQPGRRFMLEHAPAGGWAGAAAVLCIPPFAEELNRCRRMMALQARALAARGVGAVLIDLYGTGDSDGDFSAARWANWIDDLVAACNHLRDSGVSEIALWSVRGGALLGAELLARDLLRPSRWVMWQPQLAGKQALTQLLRLRTVASALGSAEANETTRELRQRLAAGESLEIAGYTLTGELAGDLDSARVDPQTWSHHPALAWFDVVAPAAPLSPATQRAVTQWRNASLTVTAQPVAGDPFWSTVEIAVVPDLLTLTTDWLVAA